MEFLRSAGLRAAFILLSLMPLAALSQGKRPLTVAASIETARAMADPGLGSVFVSPDNRRYAVLVIQGDVRRNGNWLEVVSGDLNSFNAAAKPKKIARLLMSSLGTQFGYGTSTLTFGSHFNRVTWVDNQRIAFLWGDDENISQVFAVNVVTGKVERLTKHSTDVTYYAVRPDGVLLYAAAARHTRSTSDLLLKKGFSVRNVDLYSVLAGNADGYGLNDWLLNTEIFLVTSPGSLPRKISLGGQEINRWTPHLMSFSPDGRYAVVEGSPTSIPDDWDKYTDRMFGLRIQELRRGGPEAWSVRGICQVYVIDMTRGTSKALWNAPTLSFVTSVAWAPDSRSVLVGPTFLPPAWASAAGLDGTGVAEIDIASGRHQEIPLPTTLSGREISRLRWLTTDLVEIRSRGSLHRFRKHEKVWWPLMHTDAADEQAIVPVRVTLRQDLNMPPALYATDTATGKEQMIWDLNPQLRTKFALGRVEHIRWDDGEGRTWSGLLYYPVHYSDNRRYPFVIQTHGHAPVTEFSLSGRARGLGPSSAVFAAQALANTDIAVLQMESKSIPEVDLSPAEPEMYLAGYEAAIEHLAKRGLVDGAKVGLAGLSRTGWHVQYALTHSAYPYAAAVVCTPTDPSYVWASALAWSEEISAEIGARPFGEGLNVWLEKSPGFNADKVQAPLQLQSDCCGLPSVVMFWEMFSRLRNLKKPVELYLVPDIERGSHALQNPRQLVASQQRAVDWFNFWLADREDPDLAKAEQYNHWRRLREQRHARPTEPAAAGGEDAHVTQPP